MNYRYWLALGAVIALLCLPACASMDEAVMRVEEAALLLQGVADTLDSLPPAVDAATGGAASTASTVLDGIIAAMLGGGGLYWLATGRKRKKAEKK